MITDPAGITFRWDTDRGFLDIDYAGIEVGDLRFDIGDAGVHRR